MVGVKRGRGRNQTSSDKSAENVECRSRRGRGNPRSVKVRDGGAEPIQFVIQSLSTSAMVIRLCDTPSITHTRVGRRGHRARPSNASNSRPSAPPLILPHPTNSTAMPQNFQPSALISENLSSQSSLLAENSCSKFFRSGGEIPSPSIPTTEAAAELECDLYLEAIDCTSYSPSQFDDENLKSVISDQRTRTMLSTESGAGLLEGKNRRSAEKSSKRGAKKDGKKCKRKKKSSSRKNIAENGKNISDSGKTISLRPCNSSHGSCNEKNNSSNIDNSSCTINHSSCTMDNSSCTMDNGSYTIDSISSSSCSKISRNSGAICSQDSVAGIPSSSNKNNRKTKAIGSCTSGNITSHNQSNCSNSSSSINSGVMLGSSSGYVSQLTARGSGRKVCQSIIITSRLNVSQPNAAAAATSAAASNDTAAAISNAITSATATTTAAAATYSAAAANAISNTSVFLPADATTTLSHTTTTGATSSYTAYTSTTTAVTATYTSSVATAAATAIYTTATVATEAEFNTTAVTNGNTETLPNCSGFLSPSLQFSQPDQNSSFTIPTDFSVTSEHYDVKPVLFYSNFLQPTASLVPCADYNSLASQPTSCVNFNPLTEQYRYEDNSTSCKSDFNMLIQPDSAVEVKSSIGADVPSSKLLCVDDSYSRPVSDINGDYIGKHSSLSATNIGTESPYYITSSTADTTTQAIYVADLANIENLLGQDVIDLQSILASSTNLQVSNLDLSGISTSQSFSSELQNVIVTSNCVELQEGEACGEYSLYRYELEPSSHEISADQPIEVTPQPFTVTSLPDNPPSRKRRTWDFSDRPFKCEFPGCVKAFYKRSGLDKHTQAGHRAFSRAVIYSCPVCGAVFSIKSNLKRHRRMYHSDTLEDEEVGRNQLAKFHCSECLQSFLNRRAILKHYTSDHSEIVLQETSLKFEDTAEFHSWKEGVEKETCASFIIETGLKTNLHGDTGRRYVCHRSGQARLRGSGSKAMKAAGTIKMGHYCPAQIRMHAAPDGVVTAQFFSTHIGHDFEPSRIRLSRSEKDVIAGYLLQGVPMSRILERMSAAPNTSRRLAMIRRKDLHNIMASYRKKKNLVNGNTEVDSGSVETDAGVANGLDNSVTDNFLHDDGSFRRDCSYAEGYQQDDEPLAAAIALSRSQPLPTNHILAKLAPRVGEWSAIGQQQLQQQQKLPAASEMENLQQLLICNNASVTSQLLEPDASAVEFMQQLSNGELAAVGSQQLSNDYITAIGSQQLSNGELAAIRLQQLPTQLVTLQQLQFSSAVNLYQQQQQQQQQQRNIIIESAAHAAVSTADTYSTVDITLSGAGKMVVPAVAPAAGAVPAAVVPGAARSEARSLSEMLDETRDALVGLIPALERCDTVEQLLAVRKKIKEIQPLISYNKR